MRIAVAILALFVTAVLIFGWSRPGPRPHGSLARRAPSASRGASSSLSVHQRAVHLEIELSDRRFGAHYWDPETTETDRQLLREETDRQLEALSPKEARLFGPGHEAPNLTFLPPRYREVLEAEIAKGCTDLTDLREKARADLPADLADLYDRWNAPSSELLRQQLLGFGASQVEFDAIANWPNFVNEGQTGFAEDSKAEVRLAAVIGVMRTAQLMELRDPDVQTAAQDLYRLGLPPEQASSLADLRTEGMREIQAVQVEEGLSRDAKDRQILELRKSFSSRIAAILRVRVALSEDDLMP